MSLQSEMRSNRCDRVHLGGVSYGAQVPGAPPLGRVARLPNILRMFFYTLSTLLFTRYYIYYAFISTGEL